MQTPPEVQPLGCGIDQYLLIWSLASTNKYLHLKLELHWKKLFLEVKKRLGLQICKSIKTFGKTRFFYHPHRQNLMKRISGVTLEEFLNSFTDSELKGKA